MPKGSVVIIGSGPGIGTTTAAHFASHGFSSVALVSRNLERLNQDATTVHQANPVATVSVYATDVGDETRLNTTLTSIESDLGSPEVVLFNAAGMAPTTIGNEPAANILADFKMMNIGLYVTICWAQPHLLAFAEDREAKPCFFLSGGAIAKAPKRSRPCSI